MGTTGRMANFREGTIMILTNAEIREYVVAVERVKLLEAKNTELAALAIAAANELGNTYPELTERIYAVAHGGNANV